MGGPAADAGGGRRPAEDLDSLRQEVARCEAELAGLRSRLAAAEDGAAPAPGPDDRLEGAAWERYGRQMIVPGLGLDAQRRLAAAKVLVVGAGGLGCPAAAYLAGAGVGLLGLVDADEVELSNLHRQIAHSSSRLGMNKVLSAMAYLQQLNPSIHYRPHETFLAPDTAPAIVAGYDLVLDCTDRPASRYLISDICVLLQKPLVSASAFQTSGQLLLLNCPPGQGPCYRCVFPRPPPPESVVGCGEGGILGPVVGVMGVLQALEAINILSGRRQAVPDSSPAMLLLSCPPEGPVFRTVRLRGRRPDCFACSASGPLSLESFQSSMDYHHFCGTLQPVRLLDPAERVTAAEYHQILRLRPGHILLDVRSKEHFSLGSIPGAINLPITELVHRGGDNLPPEVTEERDGQAAIYVVCRVGNDSQLAVRRLKELGLDRAGKRYIGDICGGIRAWRDDVDPTLPFL